MNEIEVVIVGAGVIGLSIALHLRARGIGPVVVVERSGVNAGASGVQPGGVRRQWSSREHCLLAHESYLFYRELGLHLNGATRPRLEPCGYLFLAHSSAKLDELATGVELQNSLGIPSQIVPPERLVELVPGLDPSSLTGAAWCGTDGYFDLPQGVVEAFAEAAVRAGAELLLDTLLTIVPGQEGYDLTCVGRLLHARHVVLAAGVESRALALPLGLELPIVPEQRYLFLSRPVGERLLEPLVVSAERRFAAKQLASGRVIASDLDANGDPESNRGHWRDTVRAGVEELAPILSYVDFDLLIDGTYDVTPDHREILGPAPELPGLWLAAGFSGHGFMMAPAVGRALATWIAGEDPGAPAASLTLRRFADPSLRAETQVV